jgi:NAD(P)-dependent dehydrogenase (short-subunit alcohol dehydrogenase family)
LVTGAANGIGKAIARATGANFVVDGGMTRKMIYEE